MPSPSRKRSKQISSLDERLYDAAIGCNKGDVQKQIALGADVNWANPKSSQNTPLIAAIAMNCSPDLVGLLISAGADVNKVNDVNETPIFVATFINNPKLVKMLIAAKADVNRSNNDGETPLLHLFAFKMRKGERMPKASDGCAFGAYPLFYS